MYAGTFGKAVIVPLAYLTFICWSDVSECINPRACVVKAVSEGVTASQYSGIALRLDPGFMFAFDKGLVGWFMASILPRLFRR